MRLLLSDREKNARITCSHCVNLKENGFCKYPILMEWNESSVRVAKLKEAKE